MKISDLYLSLWLFLVSPSSSLELRDLQGNCANSWIDGGASLGCIYMDNTARTWMDSVMYCRSLTGTLTGSGVPNTTTFTLAKMGSIADGTTLRQFLTIYAVVGNYNREWWVSGNDLAVENTWLWLSGSPILPELFYGSSALPVSDLYNCMALSYALDYYGMAKACTDLLYPVCQYSY